ncbi:MAG: hypothetical protein A3J28_05645 [Acidobacteria bacterium RIFCSPLOWO2_12_FULL_60_22]|nr:MAG: hypothetical protein A3J28_05645 [Acidobacteria bacterium RIFCSPLOWO2_12_FULL_60_22]
MRWWKKGLVLLFVVGVSAAFFTPFCHALFNCGCQVLWEGAGRFCNVHNLAGPHCPFCSTGWWGAKLPRASVWLAQAGVVLAPWKLSWKTRLALGLLTFVVVGAAVGLLFGLWTHYPVFILR